MKSTISLLALSFHAVLSFDSSDPNATSTPVSNTRKLFDVPAGESLVYPPTTAIGPKPRDVWVQAYQRAKLENRIPAIPKSTIVNYVAVYPTSYTGNPCNFAITKCNATDDINTAPPGMAGISFDDGPQHASWELLSYLKSQSQKATHFLIGVNILNNLDIFKALDQAGGHHGVHTFSHPRLTSLTDDEVLGEIGWNMQLIHDNSLGKVVCRHFRPPYGDVDDRIRAIAKHVFGLQIVTWKHDPNDWCFTDGKGSECAPGNGPQNIGDLSASLNSIAHQPKQAGLIILEHEKSSVAVAGFKYVYPILKQLRWIAKAIPDLRGEPWYQA